MLRPNPLRDLESKPGSLAARYGELHAHAAETRRKAGECSNEHHAALQRERRAREQVAAAIADDDEEGHRAAERELTAAQKEISSTPFAARSEGARRRADRAEAAVRAFASENLPELAALLLPAAYAAHAALTSAASQATLDAWSDVDARVSDLIVQSGRAPRDVGMPVWNGHGEVRRLLRDVLPHVPVPFPAPLAPREEAA